jgi:hypothetical protein
MMRLRIRSLSCALVLTCLPACSSSASKDGEAAPQNGTGNAQEWAVVFGGDSDDDNGRQHVAAGPDGSVTVGGEFRETVDFGDGPVAAQPSPGDTNSFVARFASDGKLLWKKTWDADGYIFAVTADSDMIGGWDGNLQKLDLNGDEVWNVSVDSAASTLAVGPSGELVLAGDSTGVVDYGSGPIDPSPEIAQVDPDGEVRLTDIVVAKLASGGDSTWTRRFLSTKARPQYGETVRGLAVDSDGNSVLAVGTAGVDFGLGSAAGVVLAKLDRDGKCIFSRSIAADPANFRVAKVGTDGAGAIYLVGRTPSAGADLGDGTVSGIFAAKFAPSGDLVWSRGYGGETGYLDAVVSQDGTLHLAGSFSGAPDFGSGPLASRSEYGSIFVATVDTAGSGNGSAYGDDDYNVVSGISANNAAVFVTGFMRGSIDFGMGAMTNHSPDPENPDLNVYLAKLPAK